MTRELISIREVCRRLNICRATVYNRLKTEPKFPKPVANGGKIDFFADEIDGYRDSLPRRQYADTAA